MKIISENKIYLLREQIYQNEYDYQVTSTQSHKVRLDEENTVWRESLGPLQWTGVIVATFMLFAFFLCGKSQS